MGKTQTAIGIRGNWSLGRVPDSGDTVIIDNGVGVTVPEDATFAALNLVSGVLQGNFTVTTTMNWSGGSLDAGTLTIAPTGFLNITGDGIKSISSRDH